MDKKKKMKEITIANETFILLPEKALLRKATNELIIADLHLGKGTHFNKAGMPIPIASLQKDIENLIFIINKYQPSTVIFLGDLFHSSVNSEWAAFELFLKNYPALPFILVKGNHDIIAAKNYEHGNFKVVHTLEFNDFVFSHEPIAHSKFVICGHIHPGVRLNGKAKQSLTLPCFYKTEKHFILPAFGLLTGLHRLRHNKAHQFFIVLNNKVIDGNSLI
jgi:uncharacterized protein